MYLDHCEPIDSAGMSEDVRVDCSERGLFYDDLQENELPLDNFVFWSTVDWLFSMQHVLLYRVPAPGSLLVQV